MTDASSSPAAVTSPAAHHRGVGAGVGGGGCNLSEFAIYAVGEREAMSVNMRNAGLEQLNEKYMNHLRNTMRREVSHISMDQRNLVNRFNTYSMTVVAESLVPTHKDSRSYLQYLKARQQQTEDAFPIPMSAGPQDQLIRSRTFIESQRVGDSASRTDGASIERLKLLTRPARAHQTLCPRLRSTRVYQIHPEMAPNLGKARVRTAPTPSYLLRMHYQQIEEERQRDSLPNERRAHSTLGFSVQDAYMRRRALADNRFLQLKETLVAPKQLRTTVLEQEDL